MRIPAPTVPRPLTPGLSRPRLLLLVLAGLAALLALAACGTVDTETTIAPDGSGKQTLTVTISESDLESVDGGADAVEAVIKDKNPGLTYEGRKKNGTDTVFTLALEFSDASDYAAKAKPVLEAGELTKTPEVTFTPPSPPFSSGYTLTRNFTANDLTRWAVKALVDDGKIADAEESDIDGALEQGDVSVSVDGAELTQSTFAGDDTAAVWTNAESVGFTSVDVSTAGAEDPSADSYTRTLTYELDRAVYLGAKDEFDTYFAEATPDGGELTPAGETGTTWVLAFPAGTAEQVGTWTDTALATTGSTFTVETAPDPEDPFSVQTRVVDSIECAVACAEGGLTQSLQVPAGFSDDATEEAEDGTARISLQGGPEPQVITKSIGFTKAAYDVTVDRKGGGEATMALSLPAADDAIVTSENVLAYLGEGTERSEADGLVTYTRTAEASDPADLPGALQKLGLEGDDGAPVVSVVDQGDGKFRVDLVMGTNSKISEKLVSTSGTWTIHGDGLRPTAVFEDAVGTAVLGEDTITVDETHGVILSFGAERTGLGAGAIVAIIVGAALLALLITVAVLAFLYRGKIKALVSGGPAAAGAAAPAPSAPAAWDGAAAAPSAPQAPPAGDATPPADPSATPPGDGPTRP